ncbi:MAG: glutaredoxin family protein [Burkholderiales bacterium]
MKAWTLLILMGYAAFATGAEMYRWVDEKGVVNYSRDPPPAHIRKVEQKKLGDNRVQTSEGSYSLQLATKNFPITFYAQPECEPCKAARAHLAKRGIPFVDMNPSRPASAAESATFKKLTGGGMELPLLVVGQLKTIKGYLAEEYDAALDQAGYPSTAIPGAKPAEKPVEKPPAAAPATPAPPTAPASK